MSEGHTLTQPYPLLYRTQIELSDAFHLSVCSGQSFPMATGAVFTVEDLQEVRGLRAREHLVPSTTSRDVVLCTKAPRAIQALVKEEYDRNEA